MVPDSRHFRLPALDYGLWLVADARTTNALVVGGEWPWISLDEVVEILDGGTAR